MNKNKKIKLICAFIALILCITQIQSTYSKYIDTKEGDSDFTIAKWKILVNKQDIEQAATLSSLINPVYLNNNNVKEGVIAPGCEGYFDLEIDSSEVEVSFKYVISIDTSENSSVDDLIITEYQLNDGAMIPVDKKIDNISNTISYTNPNKINTLRIYFKWLEGEGELMDNEKDTNASISNESAKLKVNMSFIQTTN